jgi:hypothetical protein
MATARNVFMIFDALGDGQVDNKFSWILQNTGVHLFKVLRFVINSLLIEPEDSAPLTQLPCSSGTSHFRRILNNSMVVKEIRRFGSWLCFHHQ